MSWSDRDGDPLPPHHPEAGAASPARDHHWIAPGGVRGTEPPRVAQGEGSTTQGQHPWRATVRTVFAAVVGLLSLLPVIAATAGIDRVPAVAQVLVVTAAVTRVLALPGVERWLRRYVYLSWLAAARG